MEIEIDPVKDAINRRKHEGLSLALAAELDWDRAFYVLDNRFHYDEIRQNAIVPLDDRLYHVSFTERGDEIHRIISLRHAVKKEVARYVKNYR
ncbi:hypothetical protein AGMMS49960_01370 [Betaproteobacteria bacterium]|nr:hypothetical protein AGMMS49543_12030 [Betaproteobacteria bacterium]GHT98396.1 hypothetical protein AGMMS49960_01370 [Betaproteobacteria bacterium]GHU16777.1 hypothetical protein AGMMS50243_03710 [Betaproteobacteria bacterium]